MHGLRLSSHFIYLRTNLTQALDKCQEVYDRIVVSSTRIQRPKSVASQPDAVVDPARLAFIERYKRTAGQKKLVCRALTNLPCTRMKVTGFSKTAIKLNGYPILDTSDDKVLESINEVLYKRNLGPLNDFQLKHSVTYGHFDITGKLKTVLTVTTAFLGSPFSVIVHVDWLASLDNDHSASKMLNQLKRVVEIRRRKSYLITQCNATSSARKFWRGKFNSSTWANALVGLIHIYDKNFTIYENCDNMMA